jgi:membrane associated rhomboid family serine protease
MRTKIYHEEQMGHGMTFGVQMLLIANIGVFIAERFFGFPIGSYFALKGDWWTLGGFWQLITYQFAHQSLGHLLSNMVGLFFLGPDTERTLGTNRFFSLYFLSGVIGGIGWSLLAPPWHYCIGASGALFGVLGAYAAFYPNRELILIFLPFTPIKAWVFVLILGAYELLHTLNGPGGAVANAAHLGGGIAGYLYATSIARPDWFLAVLKTFKSKAPKPVSQAEIDRILDKASKNGIQSLTQAEKEKLKQARKS